VDPKNLFDFGQAIEPFEQWFALLAIEQAFIVFLAEGRGQPRDFAVACRVFPFVVLLTKAFYHM
jgi:hypothetical protein